MCVVIMAVFNVLKITTHILISGLYINFKLSRQRHTIQGSLCYIYCSPLCNYSFKILILQRCALLKCLRWGLETNPA
jgi:hypothetical protein